MPVSPLIAPESLADMIAAGTPVKVLDATFALHGAGIDPATVFARERLPGAVFFDIEGVSDKSSPLPHMLPSAEAFGQAASALGLSNADRIVIYGQTGIVMGPARAWWSFRVFGHTNVFVLDGGFNLWKSMRFPLETAAPKPPRPARFIPGFRPELVRNCAQIVDETTKNTAKLLDARPAERFAGQAPEPRPGLRSGHIPGSVCLPASALIDPADGRMKTPAALEALLRSCGVTPDRPVIATCGSGVTACALALALAVVAWPDAAVYDGSWAEWGLPDRELPVATGP